MTKSNKVGNKKELSPEQREELLTTLKARFEKNTNRHQGLEWAKVRARLETNAEKLWALSEMERTGGEPDVVGQDRKLYHLFTFALPKVAICLWSAAVGHGPSQHAGPLERRSAARTE